MVFGPTGISKGIVYSCIVTATGEKRKNDERKERTAKKNKVTEGTAEK